MGSPSKEEILGWIDQRVGETVDPWKTALLGEVGQNLEGFARQLNQQQQAQAIAETQRAAESERVDAVDAALKDTGLANQVQQYLPWAILLIGGMFILRGAK
jgi:hypothetical protein